MSALDRTRQSLLLPLEAAAHAALAALAALVPYRDDDLWVFGAREGAGFADNPKYLFLHVAAAHPEVRAVWLTRDRSVARTLQRAGYEAYHVWSPRGVLASLRAGVAVLGHSTRDVNGFLVGGATLAVLWHGVPLKTVSWDAELPALPWPARAGLRYLYGRYDPVVVPGPAALEPMASGLDVPEDRLVVTGYPRNDAVTGAFPGSAPVVDEDALARLRALDGRVVLYLPTFREAGTPASEHLDPGALEAVLADLDAHLVVKLHPRESLDGVASSDRVHALPSDADVTPLLPEADALVTDYSSVYFDFLLLDRPVVFYPYDLDEYREQRGFYFEYDAVTPGPVAETDAGLAAALRTALTEDPHADARAALRERFVREAVPGARSEAVYQAVRDHQRRAAPAGSPGRLPASP